MGALILLIIGIILIFVNYRSLKKNDSASFKSAFNKATENATDFDLEIIKLRKEFAETILELQQEIENLKDKVDNNIIYEEKKQISSNKVQEINENIYIKIDEDDFDEEYTEISEETEDVPSEIKQSNNIKVKEIEKLLQEGLSIDLICEKLGVGKGEVLLVQKLYLK